MDKETIRLTKRMTQCRTRTRVKVLRRGMNRVKGVDMDTLDLVMPNGTKQQWSVNVANRDCRTNWKSFTDAFNAQVERNGANPPEKPVYLFVTSHMNHNNFEVFTWEPTTKEAPPPPPEDPITDWFGPAKRPTFEWGITDEDFR